MAELPELRADRLPQAPARPRQLFDQPHHYGAARDLDRVRQGLVPPPRTPRVPPRSRRRPSGGPWASFRRWWAGSDVRPVDLWRRVRCRTGHHDFRGGHQVQLGSRFVHIERRCIWCDAEPSL